jgi:hypothetical protein
MSRARARARARAFRAIGLATLGGLRDCSCEGGAIGVAVC